MNLMKSMVGIVILDLPYLVQKTGYIWSSVLMAFMSMITLR
jgi:amino acid permease